MSGKLSGSSVLNRNGNFLKKSYQIDSLVFFLQFNLSIELLQTLKHFEIGEKSWSQHLKKRFHHVVVYFKRENFFKCLSKHFEAFLGTISNCRYFCVVDYRSKRHVPLHTRQKVLPSVLYEPDSFVSRRSISKISIEICFIISLAHYFEC